MNRIGRHLLEIGGGVWIGEGRGGLVLDLSLSCVQWMEEDVVYLLCQEVVAQDCLEQMMGRLETLAAQLSLVEMIHHLNYYCFEDDFLMEVMM